MNSRNHTTSLIFTILFGLSLSVSSHADGSLIGKVYHPYVQPEEREFEWVTTYQQDSDDRQLDTLHKHRFGYGQSVNEYWFAEVVLIGESNRDENFDIEEIELEALWQMTEQGEYEYDWGMLFEYERSFEDDFNEVAVGLLIEKEWGRWVGAANLKLIYEGGDGIDDELETGLATQLRYRYSRELEPAIEFYSGEGSKGIGPVLMGNVRLGGRKQLYWEAGIIAGLDSDTPDSTLKFVLEFEF